VWSLVSAAIILIVCVLIPRGFCGSLCPLGTTIDLFDWAIAGRVKRFNVPGDGWWVHIKYYLLAGTMVCAVCGVLVSGFFAAIPVITRGLLFLVDPLQSGTMRGWHLVPTMNLGHVVSLILFLAVLCLSFLRPRFWCKYVCPSGAVFLWAICFESRNARLSRHASIATSVWRSVPSMRSSRTSRLAQPIARCANRVQEFVRQSRSSLSSAGTSSNSKSPTIHRRMKHHSAVVVFF
jgi:hypothetical protein